MLPSEFPVSPYFLSEVRPNHPLRKQTGSSVPTVCFRSCASLPSPNSFYNKAFYQWGQVPQLFLGTVDKTGPQVSQIVFQLSFWSFDKLEASHLGPHFLNECLFLCVPQYLKAPYFPELVHLASSYILQIWAQGSWIAFPVHLTVMKTLEIPRNLLKHLEWSSGNWHYIEMQNVWILISLF